MIRRTGDLTGKPLLATLKGGRRERPPIWLMRQAGRYLPEYRELRAEKGGFLALATAPEAAAEITLQPIRRFGFDGAILFSDILMVPWALGQDLSFGVGEGPRLAPPLVDAALASLERAPERLDAVYETVRRVAAALPAETTFLGFAGSPWTVATYMVAGQGSKDQGETRRFAYADPAAFGEIVDAITEATIDYLARQIEAGVEAVQLFDSWAGSLSPAQFERWVIAPNAAIVAGLKARCPEAVIIGFPKGAGGKLPAYARETGVDAVGLDETVDPEWASAMLPKDMPVQGNLDPLALVTGGESLDAAIDRIVAAFADRPHIFNLGHGILQDTPIAHVERLLARIRRGLMHAGFLGAAYEWVKTAHVIFVIFWMAGLFMLPRYLVYHQEGLSDPAEAARWIERETKLKRIILTPAMIAVWLLGIALAINLGLLDGSTGLGWLHAKLLIVFLLSGYHGWMVGYARRLTTGKPTLSNKALRMMNEVPALATVLIVTLVIVKPF